jgi:predicted AAA+ superfamily ATPase
MMQIKREIVADIIQSSSKKVILITGPRQTGKTTLTKSISHSYEYLNYDRKEDRKKIINETWDRDKDYLILDEIHKMKKWKLWLKGLFDTRGSQKIIVTGSARIDTHRKVGDSMAGRYFSYQLFHFDLKELKIYKYGNTEENFHQLLKFSGFPEPFLEKSESFYKKWRKTHLDVIIKEDIVEIETIKRISDLEMLIELMKDKVG